MELVDDDRLAHLPQLEAVAIDGDGSRVLIAVAKASEDVAGPDAEDRIQRGVDVVRRLLDPGL